MNVASKPRKVRDLVAAFKSGHLLTNKEYQRGEAWSDIQKAGFIDSLFRSYPVPALFLSKIESAGLDGVPVSKFEIVDGQQRLIALQEFADGKLELQPVQGGSRLRLPKSVAARPAPWAGQNYDGLSEELQSHFNETEITVFVIGPDTSPDEVRDLFIRLQSGTALSRQQIRDAWPGQLGPFVERLAGKLTRNPTMDLFGLVDKRGQRLEDEDARDRRVSDRQLCAQLLRVFIDRERDPHAFPSVSANDLDHLYHELTDFDTKGETARRFQECLTQAAAIFKVARAQSPSKKKFPRLEVAAVMMMLQDLSRSEHTKVDTSFMGKRIAGADSRPLPTGKSTSGRTLRVFYEAWRDSVANGVVRLDERRLFDDEQKRQVRIRDNGICAVCKTPVMDDEDAEFDHHPVFHRDGGQTTIDNCRLVHQRCHPRGRPAQQT